MAFSRTGLQCIGGSKKGVAPKLWLYKTNDTAATVDGSGYFDNGTTTNTGMRNEMSVGDLVYVYADADSTPSYGLHIVTANSSGVIDVTNASSLGTIDSD